jgi:hypothetical protein
MTGGPDDGAPADPLQGMVEAAVSMHAIFESYVAAGFTQQQAVYLVGVMLATTLGGPPT